MKFGLEEIVIEKIATVLACCPQVDEALIFGSRARGNYLPSSDIDIALKGRCLDISLVNRITLELDDLLLPWKIDLLSYPQIQNPDLIDQIHRNGTIIYMKPNSNDSAYSPTCFFPKRIEEPQFSASSSMDSILPVVQTKDSSVSE